LGQVRALIVAPTRELAEQIHEATAVLGRRTRVRSVTIYGGVSRSGQVAALRRGAEIVVACPGRLLDLASDRSIALRASRYSSWTRPIGCAIWVSCPTFAAF